ncbi:hypothetical protein PoB_001991400 [Plakobranchus ocellatus]|uniref:Uncharacterized protein n=1 Tax=Plakobranchus ocellatus TaxID=259542 RepID=A0AAV3ZGC0_9GAST|nr:hypothetical protein PoB_001991400 [Plakobranchus ocellatus]
MGQTDDIGQIGRKRVLKPVLNIWREKQQKASLIMVPVVGGTVNRKSASDLKGVFCHEFVLQHRCSGLIESLQTSDHLDDENANQARISLWRHNRPTPSTIVWNSPNSKV